MGEITQLLDQARSGDAAARAQFFSRVYGELDRLARRRLAGQSNAWRCREIHARGRRVRWLPLEQRSGREAVLVDLSEYDVTMSGSTTNPAGLLRDVQAALADAGRGLGVSLTWSWPFAERFDLTARVGGYYWESERELNGSFGRLTQDENGVDGTGGVSVTMRLSPAWSLGAGWEIWDAGDRNDVRAWTAVLTYRFGGR